MRRHHMMSLHIVDYSKISIFSQLQIMFIFVNKLIETREDVCCISMRKISLEQGRMRAAYLCEQTHWNKAGCVLYIHVKNLTGTREDVCCIPM